MTRLDLLIDTLCNLNNGAMQEVGERARQLPLAVRLRLIERCASLAAAVAEAGAAFPTQPISELLR